jgi:non-heme chloroperoxidase
MAEVESRDGVRIHYEVDSPDGATAAAETVVLLHAAGADVTAWERLGWVAPLLDAGLRVIRIDARGYGTSGRVTEARLLVGSPCVDDIARVLDAEGLAAAHLAGYSMGACHAIRFAEAQPRRVRSLVLGGVVVGALAIQGRHLAPDADAEAQRALALAQLDGALARLSGYGAEVVRVAREVVRAESFARPDLTHVAGMRVPALIAAGGDDRAAEPWIREELVRLLPGAQMLVVDGADHVGCLTSSALREVAVAFLRERLETEPSSAGDDGPGEAPPV